MDESNMKQQARDMNEEKEAAAHKEQGGFNHPIYAVTAKRIAHARPNPAPPIVRTPEPTITVESNGAPPVVGSVIIGVPGTVAVPCPDGKEDCEVQHLAPAPAHEAPANAPEPVPACEPEPMIYIEAERFVDARAFACRFLGCSEVHIARLEVSNGHRPFPRWQIRYTGSAGGATPLTMQARKLLHAFEFASDSKGWTDVRSL